VGTLRPMAPPRPDRPPRRRAGEQRGQGQKGKRATGRGTSKDPTKNTRRGTGGRPSKGDAAPKQWGGVARKGARRLDEPRAPDGRLRPERPVSKKAPEPWTPEVWQEEPPADAAPRPVRAAATGAVSRARGVGPGRRRMPAPVSRELTTVAGPKRAPRLELRLMEAARAYERDRYQDARRVLRRLAQEAPAAAAVRELHGLTLYRMDRWADAAKELEAFRALTGSFDQHPVLADCYRAVRRYKKVDELWQELKAASPGAKLVTEGRIVAAGALADRGDTRGAIELLERGPVAPKRPKLHHIRLWYALADLYERAGDVPRARELFRKVATADPDYANAAERLAALG